RTSSPDRPAVQLSVRTPEGIAFRALFLCQCRHTAKDALISLPKARNPPFEAQKIKPQALKVFARWQTHTLSDAAESF
ncbi:MAG: hypothetical protein ACLTXV_08955, partial [Collinsella sp.]